MKINLKKNDEKVVEIVKNGTEKKQIGKIVREFKPKTTTKICDNQFKKVAPLFIYPLMDLKQNFGKHLDIFVSVYKEFRNACPMTQHPFNMLNI